MNNFNHLNEDEIIMAIIDKENIPENINIHLNSCSNCMNKLIKFENELKNFKKMADLYAPQPQIKFRLNNYKSKSNFLKNFFQIRPAFALAISLLLFICIFSLWNSNTEYQNTIASKPQNPISEKNKNYSQYENLYYSDEAFIENLIIISYDTDYSGYFSDEFLEFVSPILLANNAN